MKKKLKYLHFTAAMVIGVLASSLFMAPKVFAAATQPAVVSSPVSGTYDEVPFNFTLPQLPSTGSLQISFSGAASNSITLSTTPGTGPYDFYINPKNITASPNVLSATSNTLPDGTYTVVVSYQDAASDPAATTTINNVIINTTSAGILINTLSPSTGTSNVSTSPDFSIKFNQPLIAETGNIALYKTSNNSLVQSFAVNGSSVTVQNQTVSFRPTVALAYNTSYYVTIASGAFQNQTGSTYTGFSGSSTWGFTTAAAPVPVATAKTVGVPNTGFGEPPNNDTILAFIALIGVFSVVGGGYLLKASSHKK